MAWTYNEPTIWLEYILDGAQAAHEHGLYTVMVTNGYITEDALHVLGPHIDAYRVDVKGFSDAQYKELCRIPDMGPVLTAAELAKTDYGCHVEIVTNVIPTFNDDETTLRGIADWIADKLGPGHAVARDPLHAVPGLRARAAHADPDARGCRAHRSRRRPRVRLPGERAGARRGEHRLPEL